MTVIIVSPQIYMQPIWTIFNKQKSHTSEKNGTEIDENENIYPI